jgi:hypothetical protein
VRENEQGDAFLSTVVLVGRTVFATSIAVRRYAILPRWVSWFGFVAGVAALASIIFFTMLLWLLWVAVASVMLFLASRPEAAAGRDPSAATS